MPIPPSTKKISDSGLTAKGEPRQFVKHSYTDRAIEEDGPLSKKDEIVLAQYDEDRVGGIFPLKLHIILKILEQEGKDHIFSWLPHGRAFGIHKLGLFEEEVMKRFFKQSQISSFRRQLNLYGFLRLSNGRDSGAYYHELFLRGKPLLSMKMVRTRIKGTKIRASSSPAEEPQFYSMPFLGPSGRAPVPTSPQEMKNPLLMMRSNAAMKNTHLPDISPPRMDNSKQDQLNILMQRNMMNSFLNQRSCLPNNFGPLPTNNPQPMSPFEALYRSLDQGRNELNARNQLLNSNHSTMNSVNDMNNMASLMVQAQYLNELNIMRQKLAGAGGLLSNKSFQSNGFSSSPPTSSFFMKEFEKQNRPSIQEDIAVNSMLSLNNSGAHTANIVNSLEV
jgi:hypothetical protein